MKRIVSALVVVCFFISGCASIVSKSQYPVTFTSNPDSAIITITNDHGVIMYTGTTPTTLTLAAVKAYFHGCSYTIEYKKDGYEPQTAILDSGMDAWFVGNILVGGLIGILIVDPLTGAMYKLDSELVVNLAEQTAALENDAAELQIGVLEDVPEHLRAQLVRIK